MGVPGDAVELHDLMARLVAKAEGMGFDAIPNVTPAIRRATLVMTSEEGQYVLEIWPQADGQYSFTCEVSCQHESSGDLPWLELLGELCLELGPRPGMVHCGRGRKET